MKGYVTNGLAGDTVGGALLEAANTSRRGSRCTYTICQDLTPQFAPQPKPATTDILDSNHDAIVNHLHKLAGKRSANRGDEQD